MQMRPLLGSTSCRDRTAEFHFIVDRLQKQQGQALTSQTTEDAGSKQAAPSAAHMQSDFAKLASRVGLGIHSTSQKLQKLYQLTKRTSMFDDPAQEISELTQVIKQDIQGLNTAIADLQNLSAHSRDISKQSTNHSHTVVDNLRTRLKDTTKEFKDVLTMRTENLKGHQDRRSLFSAAPSSSNAVARPGFGQPALTNSPSPLFGNSTFKGNMQLGQSNDAASSSEQQPLLQQQNSYQQQQLAMVQPQDSYLTSRAAALQNVESTIHELGGIFQQLAHMVQEQGELAVRIDENVEETLSNVNNAQTQLLKYLNSISSNRWLVLKIFAVLLVFLFIFIVFVA